MPVPSAWAADAPYPMDPLELAAGVLIGVDDTQPIAKARAGADLAGGLRTVVGEAIAGKTSFVSFSGGRDSSAVLAMATDLARSTGQADPVPVTLRILGSDLADETEWQDMVVRHLRLRDWIRIPVSDQLDVLGPVSTRVLTRDGLLCPFNAYSHDLIAEQVVGGGVLLTGAGGDELLDGSYAHHHVSAVLGDTPLTLRTAAGIAASVLAKPLYDRRLAREVPRLPWLRPQAQATFALRLYRPEPSPVRGWAAGVASLASMRATRGLQQGQLLIAAAHGISIVNPFLDPAVVGAAMEQGGKAGLGGRTVAMQTITHGLLPDALPTRQTKASFGDAVWTGLGRDRLRSKDMLEVIAADRPLARLIDLDRLRSEWQSEVPHGLTALLAQAAHLSLSR